MRIAILAFDRVQLLDVAGPADVFAEAAAQLRDPRAYRVKILSAGTGPWLRTACGVRLAVDGDVSTHTGPFDTVLVAGGPTGDIDVVPQPALAWLRQQSQSARRLGSVCSGSFALARAGLLDGHRAATHWQFAEAMARQFPRVQVESDPVYIRDGKLFTSAGVTAAMDLALALVEEDHGHEVAQRVARQLVMFVRRPGGQSQFSAHLAAQTAQHSAIRRVQDHVLADPGGAHTVAALAGRTGMSPRNFARVFLAETGMTPAQFVEKTRIEAAQRLLARGAAPKQVAAQVGYGNPDGLRRAFQRRLGTTPGAWRREQEAA